MKFNYALPSFKIKSEWFDDLGRKKNVYQKITYKGLYLYFQLYKFRIHNQENEHTFITSISMLRKETGYKSEGVFNLLKEMCKAKIIKINNVSRWDYLFDKDGKIKDKDILIITAIDTLPIFETIDNDYFITVNLSIFERYKQAGLNEKYCALYCLIAKWSNNTEQKMYMRIEKMASILRFNKDYVNRMIYELNRNYFMSSYRRKRKNGHGYNFEHHLLKSANEEDINKFLSTEKGNMDKLIARVEKKKSKKVAIDIEKQIEEVNNVREEELQQEDIKLGFGTKKAQVKRNAVKEESPFDNVSSKNICQDNDYGLTKYLGDLDEYEQLFG